MRWGWAAVVVLAGAALAAEEAALAEARRLVAEARPFVQEANDVDRDMAERKAPRKEAFKRLKEARAQFDRYLDANPGMEEKLDAEYVEMMVLLHGIKKDSALGELEREKDDDAAPGAKDPAAPAAPGTPEPSPAERAREDLAAAVAFEKENPGDLPQVQRRYARFLADHPDPSLPEYADAAARLGRVTDRIKSVFQEAAKRDYDSLSGSDTKDEKTFLFKLAGELSSKDPAARLRGATLLAATRARSATYFLARGLGDRDEEFAKLCRDGLVAIGGAGLGENLVKLYRDASHDRQTLALGVFADAVRKGPFEAVNQSRWIGRFTLSNDGPSALEAFRLLTSMGKHGGPGLLVGLDSRDMEKKTYTMKKLVEAGYWKAADKLAERYLVEGKGATAFLRGHAMEAIEKMGVRAVPHLIDRLMGPSGRWTGVVLSKITGADIEAGDMKKARAWWEANAPKDAE